MCARPKKSRECQCPCGLSGFKPIGKSVFNREKVELELDELESLRLCDMEDLTQEEAGIKMKVSRGTVQRLLASARKKVATALVNNNVIILKRDEKGVITTSEKPSCALNCSKKSS